MEIIISDRQNEVFDKKLIEELCVFVLRKENVADVEVSISLVGINEMAELNKRYRGIDKATDVLSFSLEEDPFITNFLGDIVLCPAEIERKAREQELTFDEYLKLLVVHSTLHLLGYSHKSDADAKVMSDKEQELLKEYEAASLRP